MLRNAEVWQQRTSHSTNVNYSKRRVCVFMYVCACSLCVFVAVVTFFVTLQSATKLIRTQYFIRISKERDSEWESAACQRIRRKESAKASMRAQSYRAQIVCVFVCVSADFDSKQKSAENFISAPLFVMFSLQLYACVCMWNSECMCVCVSVALLLHFGFGALKCGNSALPFRSPRSASFRRCR